jgi:hypothetical protein
MTTTGERALRWTAVGCVIAVVCTTTAAGCKRRTTAAPPAVTVVEAVPATEVEARIFVESLRRAVAARRVPDDILDWDAFLRRSLEGVPISSEFAAGARKGATGSFIAALNDNLQRGGSYRFLWNRKVGGERRVRFRMVDVEGGLNYHDYVLTRSGGRVRAVDLQILLAGELLSVTLRRLLLPAAVDQSRSLLERLTTEESEVVKHADQLARLAAFKRDPKAALAAYATLPPSLQQEKSVLLMRILAAFASSDAEYVAAIADFRRAHPRDACVDVISLDYYVLKQQYGAALEGLGRVEQAEGPDPYLGVIRSNILFLQGDRPGAKQALRAALQADPDLVEALRNLLTALLADGETRDAAALAADAEERRLPLGSLEADPSYRGLLASREYAAATAALRAKSP